MPYQYTMIAPTPAWVTVSASGLVTATPSAAPPGGYQGTARVQVSDGASTTTIDIPIDIRPNPTYYPDYQEETTIRGAFGLVGRITDTVQVAPEIMRSGWLIGRRAIDQENTSGGGGNGDFENMTLNFLTTGSRLGTKPSGAGAADEVRHEVRREDFTDLSIYGMSNNAIATQTTSENVECRIERSGIWQYRSDPFGTSEWLAAAVNPIEIVIDKINGVVPSSAWPSSPTELGVAADKVGQVAIVRSLTPYGSIASWQTAWIASISGASTGVPVPGVADAYWSWLPIDDQSHEVPASSGGGS